MNGLAFAPRRTPTHECGVRMDRRSNRADLRLCLGGRPLFSFAQGCPQNCGDPLSAKLRERFLTAGVKCPPAICVRRVQILRQITARGKCSDPRVLPRPQYLRPWSCICVTRIQHVQIPHELPASIAVMAMVGCMCVTPIQASGHRIGLPGAMARPSDAGALSRPVSIGTRVSFAPRIACNSPITMASAMLKIPRPNVSEPRIS